MEQTLEKIHTTESKKQRFLRILGICGCTSCYVAMFPAILVGFIGVFGLSTIGVARLLTSYQNSFLFFPIFIISLIFLIASVFRFGKTPLLLTLLGSIGVFVSMTFYMQRWLFTLSFALIAVSYFLSYRKTKMNSLKLGFILLMLVVFLGIIDTGRGFLTKSPQSVNKSVNQMNGMTK